MGQFLEMKSAEQSHVNGCVDLVRQFPLIGVRLITGPGEHRRRFVCGGFRIVYSLKEYNAEDITDQQSVKTGLEETRSFAEITIRRFAPA